jgi:hypothetical protein
MTTVNIEIDRLRELYDKRYKTIKRMDIGDPADICRPIIEKIQYLTEVAKDSSKRDVNKEINLDIKILNINFICI